MTAALRERAREALRLEVAEAICDLFAERGFDQVTVEEAVQHAGLSRASFFRYFGSKEDVVLTAMKANRIDLGGAVRATATASGETVWDLLQRAFADATTASGVTAAHVRARIRMVSETPSLRARMAERRFAQEEALTTAIAERLDDPSAARPIAIAALAVIDLAWREWAFGTEASLRAAIERSFRSLASGSNPIVHHR